MAKRFPQIVVAVKGFSVDTVIEKFFGEAALYESPLGDTSLYIRELGNTYSFLVDLPYGEESLRLENIKDIFPSILDSLDSGNTKFRFVKKDDFFYVLIYMWKRRSGYTLYTLSSSCIGDIISVPAQKRGEGKKFLKIDEKGKFVSL